MHDLDDTQLLQSYIADRSQVAFAALVRRHVNLVYAAARRQCRGDAHLAEEITQAVFIILARRAATIRNTAALPAWLISTTRFTANNAIGLVARRRRHEREAAAMGEQCGRDDHDNDDSSDELTPLLDEALAALGETDRGAVTMRFLQGRSLRDVGIALGMSEQTAQKRVSRALDKLRTFFRRRGVAMEPQTLASGLSREAAQVAPSALPALVVMTVSDFSAATATVTAAAEIAHGTMSVMAAAAAKAKVVVLAASLAAIAIAGAAVYAATSAGRVVNVSAAPVSLLTTNLPVSPLVLAKAAAGERAAGADRVVFPNALITPIAATNARPYTFGDDAEMKRQPNGEPTPFIASSGPSLMPGMRGWSIPAMSWRGKRVELSVYLRTQDVRESTGVNVGVVGSQSKLLDSAANGPPLRVAGTQDWTRMASVLDVPADAERIGFGIGLWGAGRVWLDSFAIQTVGQDVPVTSDERWNLQTQYPSKYRLVSDPSQPRGGHATARLESPGDGGGAAATSREWAKLMRTDRAMENLRGKRVRIKAMMKCENLTGGAGVFVSAGQYDAQGKYSQKESKHDLPLTGTIGWQAYATTLAVPPEADLLEYGVRLEGTGTVWTDDVAVEVISELTKKNGR